MADPPQTQVADAYAYLETSSIPETIEILIGFEKITRDEGLGAAADEAHKCIVGLLKDVNDAAVRLAGLSEGIIVRHIFETHAANRPQQGDMESHIISEPGPLGLVKVALIEELDKIINPSGYKPFWRAQEYGTGGSMGGYGGGGIPTQVGRFLRGTFEPSGEGPDAAQRGLGKGSDMAFVPDTSATTTGQISVDLPGRHFLENGAAESGLRYAETMNAIEDKWVARMEKILAAVKQGLAGSRGFSGLIEA